MSTTALRELLLSATDVESVRRDLSKRAILERISLCHTEALGGRLMYCRECGGQIVSYNPCNQRGCPDCARRVQIQWRVEMKRRLLPVAHYHLTLSAPEALTQAWVREPAAVIDTLFAALKRSVATEQKRTALRLGVTAVFHSHGLGMCYKPHLHCLVTAGGVDEAQTWQDQYRLCEAALRADFRRSMLAEAAKRLSAREAHALHHEEPDSWRVYAVRHRDGTDGLLAYFARSRHGVVLDCATEAEVTAEGMRFGEYHLGEHRQTTLSREEFFRRYFAHIPPKGAVTVRHYGLYATRAREMLRRLRGELSPTPPTPEDALPVEVAEFCPVCHCPLEPLISFSAETLPPVLRSLKRSRGSPIAHGELIQTNSHTA